MTVTEGMSRISGCVLSRQESCFLGWIPREAGNLKYPIVHKKMLRIGTLMWGSTCPVAAAHSTTVRQAHSWRKTARTQV